MLNHPELLSNSWLNHPKLISNSTPGLVPFVVHGSNRFGRVEPPRTHEKLSYEPCSLWSSAVRLQDNYSIGFTTALLTRS